MRLVIYILLSFFVTISSARSSQINELTYLTEQYPPYNFEQNGALQGIAVDLLQAVGKQSQSPIELSQINLQPWPRAYRTALIKPDTVLFSTTRTQLREHIFQWAGPISPTRIVVLAKRSRNIEISHSMVLAKYRIGVIRDDVGEQLLLELGVPRDSMVESSVPDTLAEQLTKERIDLWAYEENVAKWWIKKSGYDTDEYEVVYVLREGELYFAFNLEVDSTMILHFQQALNDLKRSPETGISIYQQILNKYR
ncbi:amino acid ABC transport signal transduction system, periplasmic protein [Vibrio orientalis CIP 102891 = ATCC 33934]|uniref:Amino acid ABC transport signal transduction system, periplasmic protein n=1 Tax=Vibrio orientalis CIP 102891 = ATCC 33934 TaxID=675816 RepID=C9QKV4_VIBOR|nr:transporter substrate-binding domain-containing protein [Vibrio orientalis]EEX92435.1 extracellular solute-binding protein, family 3 [Vibrio orientalis CIP 102891 = ATCC 33934]EGU49489.1 amino acid ABC transport signal transduction system, periplasmic protein [Vibrio orientalis CIP 102891 = ATCC 33934]